MSTKGGTSLIAVRSTIRRAGAFRNFLLREFPALSPRIMGNLVETFRPYAERVLRMLRRGLGLFISRYIGTGLVTMSGARELVLRDTIRLFGLLYLSLSSFSDFSRKHSLEALSLIFNRRLNRCSTCLVTTNGIGGEQGSRDSIFVNFGFKSISAVGGSRRAPRRLGAVTLLVGATIFYSIGYKVLSSQIGTLLRRYRSSSSVAFSDRVRSFLIASSVLRNGLRSTLASRLTII